MTDVGNLNKSDNTTQGNEGTGERQIFMSKCLPNLPSDASKPETE